MNESTKRPSRADELGHHLAFVKRLYGGYAGNPKTCCQILLFIGVDLRQQHFSRLRRDALFQNRGQRDKAHTTAPKIDQDRNLVRALLAPTPQTTRQWPQTQTESRFPCRALYHKRKRPKGSVQRDDGSLTRRIDDRNRTRPQKARPSFRQYIDEPPQTGNRPVRDIGHDGTVIERSPRQNERFRHHSTPRRPAGTQGRGQAPSSDRRE